VASRRYVPPKDRLTFKEIHGAITQKTELFTTSKHKTVRVSDETLEAAGYNKWLPDEPNFMGHCGMLRSNSLLGNTFCYEKLLFICEYKE
jgi:hypothetical protein